MKRIILSLAFCVAISGTALAGPTGGWGKVTYDKSPPPPPPAPLCFEAGEFTVDAFFGGTWGQDREFPIGDGWGGGVGLNYFLTEMFGVSARYYAFDNDAPGGSAEHDISFSAVVRFPIEELCIAPYLFGGGGLVTNSGTEGTGHLGGGIDWRFADNLGLFTDGRYTWAGGAKNNYASWNIGLRIKF
ncbi:MAG: outer membrane beta-barrel protein [Verrucomicrobiota bacterium]